MALAGALLTDVSPLLLLSADSDVEFNATNHGEIPRAELVVDLLMSTSRLRTATAPRAITAHHSPDLVPPGAGHHRATKFESLARGRGDGVVTIPLILNTLVLLQAKCIGADGKDLELELI
jgi:hypothetical protein